MTYLTDAADLVAAQKLELAARNLKHLMKVQEEQASLENIVGSLRTMLSNAKDGNTDDFGSMLAHQSNVLDATFLYFIDKAKDSPHSHDEKINLALKAQRQVERTIRTWRLISEQKKNLRTN